MVGFQFLAVIVGWQRFSAMTIKRNNHSVGSLAFLATVQVPTCIDFLGLFHWTIVD